MDAHHVVARFPGATLFDLYPKQSRITDIAKDRMDAILNNEHSTTRRIGRARMATIANLEGAPYLWGER